MSKTKAKTGRPTREAAQSPAGRDETKRDRPAIVPCPPRKRPLLLLLSIVLLAGWIVFLLVLAFGLSPTS